ncbi:hypothetical protein [Pteropox virus]|uniref:Uncharacterized protein n=1 Tax=Pteropox virus TaxID=1873698 RepID=A0A1B1MRB1_9POXV|nr:hypothetical protein [Pteropox virus]ANS71093.1 hypothetical protein [Pteropox virus]
MLNFNPVVARGDVFRREENEENEENEQREQNLNAPYSLLQNELDESYFIQSDKCDLYLALSLYIKEKELQGLRGALSPNAEALYKAIKNTCDKTDVQFNAAFRFIENMVDEENIMNTSDTYNSFVEDLTTQTLTPGKAIATVTLWGRMFSKWCEHGYVVRSAAISQPLIIKLLNASPSNLQRFIQDYSKINNKFNYGFLAATIAAGTVVFLGIKCFFK